MSDLSLYIDKRLYLNDESNLGSLLFKKLAKLKVANFSCCSFSICPALATQRYIKEKNQLASHGVSSMQIDGSLYGNQEDVVSPNVHRSFLNGVLAGC